MKVAKSYEKYERIGEPFKEKGRFYTKINMNGKEKIVRLYTENEYATMYDLKTVPDLNQRIILGFGDKGYITVLFGIDDENHKNWLREIGARYATVFGWYIISTLEVPQVLPEGVTTKRIYWDQVGNKNNKIKSKEEIKEFFKSTQEEFAGKVGERIERIYLIHNVHNYENEYGQRSMIIMLDTDGNTYVWNTSYRNYASGTFKKLRGTIKKYDIYNGKMQCILTNCREVK